MRNRNITENELVSAYSRLFTGETGLTVLSNLVSKYHKRGSFVRGDPYETAYKEGARSVVLHIKSMVQKHGKREDLENLIDE
jgi:hypothetical protein